MALAAILTLALCLRLWRLAAADSYTDEVLYAFRAIGLVDYDTSSAQTTPWQWFAEVPWWARLSFHDHPLIFFLVEHWSISLLGVNLWAVRLPSVLAGLATIFFTYLVGREISGRRTGLLAALILSFQSYHLWVSRLGIQDSLALMWVMGALAAALLARRNPRFWLLAGICIGLGVVTKYTTLIAVPLVCLAAIIYRVPWRRTRAWWYGLALVAALVLPSVLYNIFLYRARGHFDFQISAALGQHVPEWTFRLGRLQVGDLSDRFINFWKALVYANSQAFNIFSVLAVAWAGVCSWRRPERGLRLLLAGLLAMGLWFLAIGSAYRFVVMAVPFLALAAACLWAEMIFLSRRPRVYLALFALWCLWELGFSVNTFLRPRPWGPVFVTQARINEETRNYGFNQLDTFLSAELAGSLSYLIGDPDYNFLDRILAAAVRRQKEAGAAPRSLVIVYDNRLNFLASLWTLDRHLLYEGWPVMDENFFSQLTGAEREEYYRRQGAKEFIYIAAAGPQVLRSGSRFEDTPGYEQDLLRRGVARELIVNGRGEPAFWIYRL